MSALFGSRKGPAPVEEIDPSEDARQLRRRIAGRGGEQSTLLAGRLPSELTNVFAGGGVTGKKKKNLGGTRKSA